MDETRRSFLRTMAKGAGGMLALLALPARKALPQVERPPRVEPIGPVRAQAGEIITVDKWNRLADQSAEALERIRRLEAETS